jgi:hypothetical protein
MLAAADLPAAQGKLPAGLLVVPSRIMLLFLFGFLNIGKPNTFI